MWREIRGRGLAYDYNLQLLPGEGLITLKLMRAAQLMEAYRETVALLVRGQGDCRAAGEGTGRLLRCW